MNTPIMKTFDATRRLLSCALVLGIASVLTVGLNAQGKSQPPQPGNGWINTPSGNRQMVLRHTVTVEVRKEGPVAALGRVVGGQAAADPKGLDTELKALGSERVSLEFTMRDGKSAYLALPKEMHTPMILLHGFGLPTVYKLGSKVIPFSAKDFVEFAKMTAVTRIRFQVLMFDRSNSLHSLPVELKIEPARELIRLEY